MNNLLLDLLRCPVTRSALELHEIKKSLKVFNGREEWVVGEGILHAEEDWFYPIIDGIPRVTVDAFIQYEDFFLRTLSDYGQKRKTIEQKYPSLIRYVRRKNKKTKESFSFEWGVFNYEKDKTWKLDSTELLQKFLDETDETIESLRHKLIFDAGCGHGLLNQLIAEQGSIIVGMDLSNSIERAYHRNVESNAFFIEGDVQFPPVAFEKFDIVHSSGVLIHTNNTELSFSCIEPCVKKEGKLSVWLYHPRKDFIHRLFNRTRGITSKLPVRVQYYLYLFTLFPISFVIKRIKGNKETPREMMVAILDWFSPEFRWEHEPSEVASWFYKRNFKSVKITTVEKFGFNMVGTKKS